ncbi:hypothetical protein DFH27DRAFT_636027 [Peziza echinospora]|nr:hypothetical protein DFH27DRAFT_636027 [Peziza echinospora]
MAPPAAPHTQNTLTDRLLNLVKTLQFSWFMGFNSTSTIAQFSYRLAFLSAAVTYGIVVFKAYRGKLARGGQGSPQQQALALLGDENVQYLVMAFIWLYSKPIWFALWPFTVYSTFHFLTYLRTNVIPTFIPATITAPGPTAGSPRPSVGVVTQHPISEAISRFVKQNYDTSMHLVSNLEIFLFVRLLLGAVVFANSWVLLLAYATFLRVRYTQSQFVRQAFTSLDKKGDALVNDARVPEQVRSAWIVGKDILKKVADATEFGKPAPSSVPRKAQ